MPSLIYRSDVCVLRATPPQRLSAALRHFDASRRRASVLSYLSKGDLYVAAAVGLSAVDPEESTARK